MSAEAYPLAWPGGWPRAKRRARSQFASSLADSRDHLVEQLRMLGAKYPVISTNIETRRDGLPYANRAEPVDPGVAVYFLWRGKQMTFACDRWDRVRDNIRAIGKTVEALRGIERWGASDMMDRAFSAFEALPAPGNGVELSCWAILEVDRTATAAEIERAYRAKAKAAHPDAGGSRADWDTLRVAYDSALRARHALGESNQ